LFDRDESSDPTSSNENLSFSQDLATILETRASKNIVTTQETANL